MDYIKKEYEPTKFLTTSFDYSSYTYLKDSEGMNIFTKGLKDKKILGVKCKGCGKVYVPPIFFCNACFEELDLKNNIVECEDRGKIVFYTVSYSDIRGAALEEPSIAFVIKFHGSDSFWMSRLRGVKPEEVEVGKELRVLWKEERKGALSDIQGFEWTG